MWVWVVEVHVVLEEKNQNMDHHNRLTVGGCDIA